MYKIDSIIYFDDFQDLERFNSKVMTAPVYSDQRHYENGIKQTALDTCADVIPHILCLISNCHDFYRVPTTKFRPFPEYMHKYGISFNQTDIESIMHNLHKEVFCKGSCSTDSKFWRKTFLKFEFYNTKHKFSNDRYLPLYAYYEFPLVIYTVIAEDLITLKTFALVSFSCYEFERILLTRNPAKRVNLNFVEKTGSVYLVSVVARPYSIEDPFFEFFISEGSYNRIIHLIEGLTVKLQMKYPVHYKCDAYNTFVQYKSLDPINHGLPIPVKYFFC